MLLLSALRRTPALLPMLALLLTGCASPPNLQRPVPGPLIPPLPAIARQPPAPPTCSPSCSAGLSTELQSWPITLTRPAPPARPASAPTTHSLGT